MFGKPSPFPSRPHPGAPQDNRTLTDLDLGATRLKGDDAQPLVEALQRNTAMRHLSLRGNAGLSAKHVRCGARRGSFPRRTCHAITNVLAYLGHRPKHLE